MKRLKNKMFKIIKMPTKKVTALRRAMKKINATKPKRKYKKVTNRVDRGFMGMGNQQLAIFKGIGFPSRLRVHLRYHDVVEITCTAGARGAYLFRCNSLFDPDYTGTGHQPMCYDQLAVLYNHYKVIGSKIRVDLIDKDTTLNVPCEAALLVDDETTPPISMIQTIEQGRLKQARMLGGQNNTLRCTLTNTWSLKKFFKDKYQSDEVCAGIGANPTELMFYDIILQPVDGSSTVTYSAAVTIDYIADFFEPQTIGTS